MKDITTTIKIVHTQNKINPMINHLIYITNPYSSAVVESQVYKLLEYFTHTDQFKEITLIQIYNNKKNLAQTLSVLDKYTFNKIFIKGKVGFFSKINPLNYRISKVLAKIIYSDQFIIHTRTEIIGYFTINALKKLNLPLNLLVDFRGATKDEIEYRINNEKRSIYLELQKYLYPNIEKVLKNNSNIAISAVSNSLKNYLNKYINLKNKICIHPNIADSAFSFDINARKFIRKKYGLNDNQILIVVSTSGSEAWQNDFQIISQFLNKEPFFIFNLSPKVINGNNIINTIVPFHEMPRMLSAADIGVVWREKHILNKCASPSKFSEFAVMGLYVITNKSIDLIDDFIQKNNSGYSSINPSEIIPHILSNKSILNLESRIKRIKAGKKTYSIENIAMSYITKYNEILKIT